MTKELEIAVGVNLTLIRWILTMLAKNGTILGQDMISLATSEQFTEPEELTSGGFPR